jgi:hypothetical protein
MWNPICKDIELTQSTMEDTKRFEEQAYQTRLDNVLKKFDEGYDDTTLEYALNSPSDIDESCGDLNIFYYCQDKAFRITYDSGYGYTKQISLETVESLLKDLEQ